MGLSLYKSIVRPALFLTSPETAHYVAKWAFRRARLWKLLRWRLCVEDERLQVKVGQLTLANPVGLAAGFDKNCEMYRALLDIGFGYVVLGTVTINPREGNPKPRMWRYPGRSLVNSMGLPNDGARKIAGNLSRSMDRPKPLVVSISGLSEEEFVDCYREIVCFADAIELNISTPNTVGVRIFQDPAVFKKLLDGLGGVRDHGKPFWVKIPPYFTEKERENVLELVDVAVRESVDAITAVNTRIIQEPRASIGTGGLSGPLIFKDMLRIVSDVYQHTRGKIPINACGGISSAQDTWEALKAGASSVQLYTALIYEGPRIVSSINQGLLRMLEDAKLSSLSELTGAGEH